MASESSYSANLQPVTRYALLVTGFLLIFLAFFFLFWRPGFADLRRYRRELRDKETELIQLERDAEDWPDTITREMLGQYEDELERLWSLIPSEEEIATLLDEIQTHARAANLDILSLTRSPTVGAGYKPARTSAARATKSGKVGDSATGEPKYVRVPYKISLGGGYSGLVRFLQMLEDSERLVTVVSIRMYASSDSATVATRQAVSVHTRQAVSLSADIQFNIFYSRMGVETG